VQFKQLGIAPMQSMHLFVLKKKVSAHLVQVTVVPSLVQLLHSVMLEEQRAHALFVS